ncbi:MAG: hypothetical protein Kow006_22580 [Gammaproteobacteria bacterium]
MVIRVGDVVSSIYGTGIVVAMSEQWCIHRTDDGMNEAAVPWSEVHVPIKPAAVTSQVREYCGIPKN